MNNVMFQPLTEAGSSKNLWHVSKAAPIQVRLLRWLTGWAVLCSFLLLQFQPALLMAAVLLVDDHGHAHEVVFRADGSHVDMVLTHPEDADGHEHTSGTDEGSSLLCAMHDHKADGHVLHFNKAHLQDKRQTRNNVIATWVELMQLPREFLVARPEQGCVPLASSVAPRPPPALVSVRTTVLLI